MNVEIIEFYPLERDECKEIMTGTLRARLPDLGIHILGIYVSKRKDFWFFRLPGNKGTHNETREVIRYPALVFEEKEQQSALMEAIKEKGRAFIERRLDEEAPPEQKQPPTKDNPKVTKETTAKEQLLAAIAGKEWRDPSPLKSQQAKKQRKFPRDKSKPMVKSVK